MVKLTESGPAPEEVTKSERQYSALYHLASFAYILIPAPGLYASNLPGVLLAIFLLHRPKTQFEKLNASRAFNFNVLIALLWVPLFAIFHGHFLDIYSYLISRGAPEEDARVIAQRLQLIALSFAYGVHILFTAAAGIMALDGRILRYPFSLPLWQVK